MIRDTRGNVPSKEIDPDVKEQYYKDQNRKLLKQVQYLSINQPCSECGSQRHTTTECPHTEQVRMAETYGEVAYAGGPNCYMGDQRFQQPQWNQGAPRNPPPYRAPGHPERDQQKDNLQLILDEMRRNQGTINHQFQNINTKLGEIDVWRKSVDTQNQLYIVKKRGI